MRAWGRTEGSKGLTLEAKMADPPTLLNCNPYKMAAIRLHTRSPCLVPRLYLRSLLALRPDKYSYSDQISTHTQTR